MRGHGVAVATGSGVETPRGAWAARKILTALLANVQYGRLTVVLPSGGELHGAGALPGPHAIIQMHRWRMFRRLALRGDLGFAESYMDGDWSSPDLAAVIRFADTNYQALMKYIYGYAFMRMFSKAQHAWRSNTRRGSRKNIEFHYDLGNDFYRLWLDDTMTYSSAIYAGENDTLEKAQQRKIARIAELAAVSGGKSVLEIGCGWGAMAQALASAGAARVTGLTLSPAQAQGARQRAATAGFEQQIDIRIQDYRDVSEQFDRIVSIEMIEAVGEEFWPVYFRALHDRLAAGGHAIVQAITISPERFESYRSSVDFIQRYIFPGGMLLTPPIIEAQARAAGLRYECVETFGQSYARTLLDWRRSFNAAWPRIAPQGFDARFRNMWEYYLAYCEGGFANGTIDVGLYRLTKPAS
ncbi:MAG: class I SAM-dependent methyltransferase [Alphaproteobacteria bacterium]|nr:class I SAM-dependent methyltransferase [Alphaproteobacteria bacterium]